MRKKVLLRTNNLSELRAIQASTSLPDESSKTGPAVICPEGLSGDELFRWAMKGVEPISRDDIPRKKARIVFRLQEDPFEEIFHTNSWPLVWYLQSEHIEGADPSVSRATLKKLRRGHFSVRAECDLHRLSQREARDAVISFIEESARRGLGCVRIVHGKGNNSHDKIPVLKVRLQEWLFHRRLSRHVLAYSSARPCDGGTGAIYVLLRKK